MAVKKRGLGRGLDSLLGPKLTTTIKAGEVSSITNINDAGNNTSQLQNTDRQNSDSVADNVNVVDGKLKQLPVEFIQRGKYQPRCDMASEALEELAESIKAHGVMQPIIVRPIANSRYEIIAGERRWRATQLAELDTIPVIIREVSDEDTVVMALIENIQREDLNPIEEATALKRLQTEFQLTQQEIAEAVGKSRSTVANLLRLMSLREDVRLLLERGDLEMGHAKCLLGLPENQQSKTASTVVSKGLSVRQTEALVRRMLNEAQGSSGSTEKSADIKLLEEQLSQKIGAQVSIDHCAKNNKGKLLLKYNSLDELDGILRHIS